MPVTVISGEDRMFWGGGIFRSRGSTLALLIDFFVDWLPYIVVARRKAGTTTTAATAAVPDHDITPPGAARPAAARCVGSVELARGCYDEGQVKATCALRSSRVESSPASRRRPTPTTARDVRRTTQTSVHLRLAGRHNETRSGIHGPRTPSPDTCPFRDISIANICPSWASGFRVIHRVKLPHTVSGMLRRDISCRFIIIITVYGHDTIAILWV